MSRLIIASGRGTRRSCTARTWTGRETFWKSLPERGSSGRCTRARLVVSEFRRRGIGDEETPVSERDMQGAYKRSKFLAEQVAIEFARKGFPVVIVNPTAPVGDHDWKPTPTGKIVVDFLRRKMPAYVDTGLNVVDVRDVANGHLLACERGRSGQRYILGGENLTLQQIFEKLESISGLKAPNVRIPYGVAYAAGLVSTAVGAN